MSLVLALLGFLLLGSQGAAHAQGALPLEAAPGRAVYQPGSGVADGADPLGVAQNPATIGSLNALGIGLRHSETGAQSPFAGRGSGLYAAGPITRSLPYLRALRLGAGIELLRPTGFAAALPAGAPDNDLFGRLIVNAALSPLPSLALGLSYSYLLGAPGAAASGLQSVDLGLRVRSARLFALGLVVHDLNGPAQAGFAVQRSYELELLARPSGDERVELGLSARVGEQRADVAPRLRLLYRPIPGLALGAEAATLHLPEAPLSFRVALGLELQLGSLGGSLYGMLRGGAGGLAFEGGSVALRLITGPPGEEPPPLWQPRRLYRVQPGGVEGADFLRLLWALSRVKDDPRAEGVVLLLSGLSVGWGRAVELHRALMALRRAHKRVFAYAGDLDAKGYLVASAAERIYLDPTGELRAPGVAFTSYYIKDALERFGVRVDLERIGAYKSTPETFTRSGPTPEAQQQRQQLAEDLFRLLRDAVAAGRRLPAARVGALLEHGPHTPPAAQQAGLVDAVATAEEVDGELSKLLGHPLRVAALPRPGDDGSGVPHRVRAFSRPGVAVVNLEGDLLGGESLSVPAVDLQLLGAQTALRALQRAGADAQARAIVVRVDSPGGSAAAADLIAREIDQLRQRKPVVCSFGDIAASGGYYLASHCDEIFVSEGSITGSIGIFGGKVDVSALAARLQVQSQTFGRGPHADMQRPTRPFTEEERALLRTQLQYGYDRFVQVVQRGRRLSRAQVEASAAGQVFTGARAVARRLCDQLGGLDDALDAARRRAGLGAGDDIDVLFYPRADAGLLPKLLQSLGLPGGLPFLGAGLRALLLARALEAGAVARLEGPVPR